MPLVWNHRLAGEQFFHVPYGQQTGVLQMVGGALVSSWETLTQIWAYTRSCYCSEILSAVEATSSCHRQFHFSPDKFPAFSGDVFFLCHSGQAPSAAVWCFPQPITAPHSTVRPQSAAEPLHPQLCVAILVAPHSHCPPSVAVDEQGAWTPVPAAKGSQDAAGEAAPGLFSARYQSSAGSGSAPHLLWVPRAVLFEHSRMHPSVAGERHHLAFRFPTAKQLVYVVIS